MGATLTKPRDKSPEDPIELGDYVRATLHGPRADKGGNNFTEGIVLEMDQAAGTMLVKYPNDPEPGLCKIDGAYIVPDKNLRAHIELINQLRDQLEGTVNGIA